MVPPISKYKTVSSYHNNDMYFRSQMIKSIKDYQKNIFSYIIGKTYDHISPSIFPKMLGPKKHLL
jgi:hypothetical protein